MTAARLNRGVRQARPEDAARLAAFQARWYGPHSRQVDPACVAWRFADNPFTDDGGPQIWICERDGEIVGQQASLPLHLHVRGQRLLARWNIDLMVDERWRLKGVAHGLMTAATEPYDVVASLGIAEAAQRAMRRAGWRDVGNIPRWWRALRPLPEDVAGRKVSLATRLAHPLLSAADGLVPLWLRGSGTTVEAVERFDERVEAIWQACGRAYPVIARRDLMALRWRFDHIPAAREYERFILFRRGRPFGYLVLRVEDQIRRNLRRALIVDYLCPRRGAGLLFAHAIRLARQRRADVVQCLSTAADAGPALQRLGFVRRPGQQLMVFLRNQPAATVETLLDADRWFVTFADSDLDHLPAQTW